MDKQSNWEQRTIEKIALSGIAEQKRKRRWGIFFKVLFFVYIAVIVAVFLTKSKNTSTYDVFGFAYSPMKSEHIALVRLNGAIAFGETANAELLNATLRQAMSEKNVKGVLLLANSPGGSPVQSSLVYKNIMALKETYHKPIYTAVTDTCASGCYYIAAATDKIFADESSIVGSIGVISQSYGYADAAEKLGITPRTFTAGKHKDFMNPARPMRADEVDFLKQLLDELHHNFIAAVKQGRGQRLSNDDELFSGLFWTGTKAKALGLIDGIATPMATAKQLGDYPVLDYMFEAPFDKVLKRIGVTASDVVSETVGKHLTPKQQIEFK